MLTIDDMSFAYRKKPLFKDLNMTIEKGNIYGLLGLNGSGKTTLIKLLCGLLFPDSGRILLEGTEPRKREPSMLSRISILPEEFSVPSVLPHQYVGSRAPFYPLFDHQRFNRYLKEFNIDPKVRLDRLSYGQKKKFLLAFSLASSSELLILDEPSNGLDIPSKEVFRRLVAEALTKDRIFVISTHQVADISLLVDAIKILHEGRILFQSNISDIEQHIHMKLSSTLPAATPDLLHTEATVGGYWSVWKGCDEAGGVLHLETLFNAVIAHPSLCEEIFDAEQVPEISTGAGAKDSQSEGELRQNELAMED